MYKNHLKRLIDFTVSLIALVVLFPVFLLLGILIKLDSKGPAFFLQKRIGKNKKEFYWENKTDWS